MPGGNREKVNQLSQKARCSSKAEMGKTPKGPNEHQSVEEGWGRERSLMKSLLRGGNTPTQGPARKAEGQLSRVHMYRAEPIEYRGKPIGTRGNPINAGVPGITRRKNTGEPVSRYRGETREGDTGEEPMRKIPGSNP